MLGTFRLVLALMVALSHVNLRIGGLNPGVIAVIGFYLISGYVMTGLIRRHYHTWQKIPAFYVDRALRLFPQYFLFLSLTMIWFFASGKTTDFLQHQPELGDWMANIFVVPLNYFMFNQTAQFTAIPPAWSLGAEIQFYLLIPVLLLLNLRWLAVAIGSVVFAMAAIGWLNTDYFGYRLLPGVLLFFLLGSFMFDVKDSSISKRKFLGIALLLLIVVVSALSYFQHLERPYNRETLIGIACGLPLLAWLGTAQQTKWDDRLGDLSYGVFLNHFLIQWGILGVPANAAELISYVGISLVASYISQRLVEQPVLKWRKKLRQN